MCLHKFVKQLRKTYAVALQHLDSPQQLLNGVLESIEIECWTRAAANTASRIDAWRKRHGTEGVTAFRYVSANATVFTGFSGRVVNVGLKHS